MFSERFREVKSERLHQSGTTHQTPENIYFYCMELYYFEIAFIFLLFLSFTLSLILYKKQIIKTQKNEIIIKFLDRIRNTLDEDILKQIINSVVDIVDNFIIELGEDEYLSLSSTSRYDERVGSSQRNTTSKIETMCIKKMNSEEKMKEFIYKYGQALDFLNREERQVFIHLFIKKSDTLTIYDDMKIGSNQYNVIKKSYSFRKSKPIII